MSLGRPSEQREGDRASKGFPSLEAQGTGRYPKSTMPLSLAAKSLDMNPELFPVRLHI